MNLIKAYFSIRIISIMLIVLPPELNSFECRINDPCRFSMSSLCMPEVRLVSQNISQLKGCNELDCQCSSGDNTKSPLRMTKIDKYLGKLNVDYTIVENLSHFVEMEIILRVNNTLNKTECHKCYKKECYKEFGEIMRKTLELKQCDSSNNYECKKATDRIAVNFQSLHTACYQVEIRHFQLDNETSVVSCPKYFETGYANSLKPPNMSWQFLKNEILHVNILSPINGNTDPELFWMLILEENNATNYYFPNKSNSEILEDGLIRYHYNSLKPGNYCLALRYMNDFRICEPNYGYCQRNCFWSCRINLFETHQAVIASNDLQSKMEYESPWRVVGLIVGLAIGFLITITVVSIIALKRKTKRDIVFSIKSTEQSNEHLLPSVLSARKKILLLYPRDCQLFMDAIAKLRTVLGLNGCEMVWDIPIENMTKIVTVSLSTIIVQSWLHNAMVIVMSGIVFDVWDPKLSEIIRTDPVRFVQLKVTDDETTTMVVAGECSKLISDSYNETVRVHYKMPEEFDNLFLFGLKYIIENFRKKCYVVRLLGQHFNEQYDNAQISTYINILEDYKLPLHLEKLILTIHSCGGIHVQQLKLHGLPEIHQFKRLVDDFSEYKLRNPDYLLNELLTVSPRDDV